MNEVLADAVRRIVFQRSVDPRRCIHLAAIGDVPQGPQICSSCQEHGLRWVQLRMCLTCGSVGCCDSSPEPHARAHFELTGHPVIRSIEPGQAWAWCYLDGAYVEPASLRT